jgi:polyhydroxybutyrate depolymerase
MLPLLRSVLSWLATILLLFVLSEFGFAKTTVRSWDVDGVTREATIVEPKAKSTTPSPLVFVFHGHGGTMEHMRRSCPIHEHWPEALVIYMQGLKTPGQLTDPEGKRTGWQSGPSDQNDRDLKFFDTVIATTKKEYLVDEKRIYSTGHSNGGGFTYLLAAVRGHMLAAIAPSGAAALKTKVVSEKPISVLHIAGQNDPLVKYDWQKIMIARVKQLNLCSGEGKPWHSSGRLKGTIFTSETGSLLVTLIHDEGHKFPHEAPELIVKFFKEHAKA